MEELPFVMLDSPSNSLKARKDSNDEILGSIDKKSKSPPIRGPPKPSLWSIKANSALGKERCKDLYEDDEDGTFVLAIGRNLKTRSRIDENEDLPLGISPMDNQHRLKFRSNHLEVIGDNSEFYRSFDGDSKASPFQ